MDLHEIKRQIKPVLQKYGVTKASIVGSVARNEEIETSDIPNRSSYHIKKRVHEFHELHE